MSELRGFGAISDDLERLGVRMLVVSVDPPEKSRGVVAKLSLPFPILCDVDREVIRSYGLVHEGAAPGGGDIAIPTLLLIDRDGRILWRRSAALISDRPAPADILDAVRQHLRT